MTRDTLVALLAVHGPRSLADLTRLAGLRRTQYWLHRLWDDDLVEATLTGLWRLTDRGHERAAVLREDEPRFTRLTRTR